MNGKESSWLGGHRRLVVSVVCLLVLAGGLAVTFAPGVVAPPWSRLNNIEQGIDLYSGRIRVTRHFLYLQVSREVCETPLSKALAGTDYRQKGGKWVKANVSQPGASNSLHIPYPGAFAHTGFLTRLWQTGNFDEGARAKTAAQLLRVWRERRGRGAAEEYCDALLECVVSRDPHRPTSADEIPDDLPARIPALSGEEEARR